MVFEKPSKAQRPTPHNFRERSNQRVTLLLEGHGSAGIIQTVIGIIQYFWPAAGAEKLMFLDHFPLVNAKKCKKMRLRRAA